MAVGACTDSPFVYAPSPEGFLLRRLTIFHPKQKHRSGRVAYTLLSLPCTPQIETNSPSKSQVSATNRRSRFQSRRSRAMRGASHQRRACGARSLRSLRSPASSLIGNWQPSTMGLSVRGIWVSPCHGFWHGCVVSSLSLRPTSTAQSTAPR